MLRVVADDHSAFEELMARYQDRMISFFFQLVRDRTMAEDMAQEVFLRVFRARSGYSAKARFSTWLYRIAHNLASNQKRGLARRKEVSLSGARGENAEASTPADDLAEKSALMPTRVLHSREMRDIVHDAFCLLYTSPSPRD